MFDPPALQPYLTAQHNALREKAARYFTRARFENWPRTEQGFVHKSVWHEIGQQGFLGISLPAGQGGQGLGILGSLIINEALSNIEDVGISLGMHIQNEITSYWLASCEQPQPKQAYLPGMLSGRLLGCTCDTEPTSDMKTTAVRDGDDLIVTGKKVYIVNGYNADLCFVSLKLDSEMATVLVEKDREGVKVSKIFDKFGTRAIDSVTLEFDHVRVPATHVVSRRGVQLLMHWNMVMTRARFLISADAYFIHKSMLARMLDYGMNRKIGSRPLAQWPINRQALARAKADSELMCAGIINLLKRFEANRHSVAEAAALKWFCVDRAVSLSVLCAEMEGGAGYMHDSPFLLGYAQARGLTMAGGTQTTMKVIANGAFACQEELADAH